MNQADRERISWFQEIGCLPCRLDGNPGVPADVCHETQGGRRTGHAFTFPGCAYHHRGLLPDGMSGTTAAALYGPSFAVSKRSFEEQYGTERELCEMTDRLISELQRKAA